MLSLLAAVLVVKSIQPMQSLPIPMGTDVPAYGYTRETQFDYEYLATPNGVYRSRRLATITPELVAFPGEPVSAVEWAGNLFAVKGGGIEAAHSSSHTFVMSTDFGHSWALLSAGLRDCAAEPCGYLVPTRLAIRNGRAYVNAGGNMLVTRDFGESWRQLYGLPHQGKPTAQLCPLKFALGANDALFLGGECPLDVGWLSRGTLRPDGLGWAEEPQAVKTPDLENRNVQFIRDLGNGVVFAGIEGALLKSTDGGASFRFVIHYELDAEDRYPYIGHMLISTRDPRLMIVGGFDKKNDVGYLAYSSDAGETWQDVSPLVGTPYVVLLAEDADGRVLAGLQDRGTFTLAEVILGEARKRRAVR